MSFKKKFSLIATAASAALLLAACGGGDSDKKGSGSNDKFVEFVENEGKPIDGEKTLRIGMVSDAAFPGIFSWELYSFQLDNQLMAYNMGNIFAEDENYQYNQEFVDGALGKLSYDKDRNVATVTLQKGAKWQGNDEVEPEEVTVDDIVFAYEIICDPEYDGVRYGDNFEKVKGVEEYHNGEADSISGLVAVDDYNLEIHFKEPVGFQVYQAGGLVWGYAAPRHYLGDIPVTELQEHERVREHPIGFGPFQVNKMVPGESVEYVANKDYFGGAPKIDKIVVERVPTSGIVAALQAGEFDLTLNFPSTQYEAIKDGLDGYTILGTTEGSYEYLAFKLGKWNAETGMNEYDPNSKMANLNLRQAMAYSLDIDQVGERFYQGLRFRATSHIVPVFGDYMNKELKGYPYDPEKAKELLDEAGYKDVDGDGFREDPDGNELVINYMARANSDAAEPIAKYYLQAWEAVGLNVQLVDGRLHEVNTFYDRVQADDPKIDVHEGGWGVGSDPTPTNLYGEKAAFNFSRFVDEKNTEFFKKMSSVEALDEKTRYEIFHEWQEYFLYDVAPVIPTIWRTELQLVSNRVSAWAHDSKAGKDLHKYGLHVVDIVE
ncbi:oligopeptide ABC transporter substrate-binding protein [Allofustis seminis]|uniref:oligopeptide ABC transporter substrate-binding protein n=1 Tax=Allofustis seminis TaxID=166939 RepID=UPI00037484DF|nr:oligopeptide ABC transporter substrate-binding protein [Allofustis seminis]